MVRLPPLRLVIGLFALVGMAKAATAIPGLAAAPSRLILVAANAQAPAAAQAAGAKGAAGKPGQCTSPDLLLQSVAQERALIARQKAALDKRSAQIDLADQALKAESARLGGLRDKIKALLQKAGSAHQADVQRLVKLYQAMKPADAARILNDMDIAVTVTVLATMNERNAAPIMAQMSPVRARAVSQIILERSKLPGDQRLVGIRLN